MAPVDAAQVRVTPAAVRAEAASPVGTGGTVVRDSTPEAAETVDVAVWVPFTVKLYVVPAVRPVIVAVGAVPEPPMVTPEETSTPEL